MTSRKYKIKIEEFPAVIKASAKTGNWLFGYSEVPFILRSWRKLQYKDYSEFFSVGNFKLSFDTEIDIADPQNRTVFYKDGKFQLSGVRGVTFMCGPYLKHINREPIHEVYIQRYEPIIRALEERVGKVLIEREKESKCKMDELLG